MPDTISSSFASSFSGSSSRGRRQAWAGLLVRKECWRLSWRGWVGLALILLLGGLGFALTIHPFLAVTRRAPATVLVVEGWTHNYGVAAAVQEFQAGRYARILTTGGPVSGYGPESSIYDTDAWQSAGALRNAGIPADTVQSVPSRFVGRDRTYNSAIALQKWLRIHSPGVDRINVLTEDAHARRTWLIFQNVLEPGVKVGIISVPNPDYDASHWWKYSEGVRQVIDETIAYVYAKLFFWPTEAKS